MLNEIWYRTNPCKNFRYDFKYLCDKFVSWKWESGANDELRFLQLLDFLMLRQLWRWITLTRAQANDRKRVKKWINGPKSPKIGINYRIKFTKWEINSCSWHNQIDTVQRNLQNHQNFTKKLSELRWISENCELLPC